MRHEYMLDPTRTALVILDMQEAFRQPISDFAETAARIALIAHAAQLLDLPVLVTEQYPQGLGRTATELRAVLPSTLGPIEKTAFSACGSEEFVRRLDDSGRTQVLLCGLEAHICVNQTAHDLIARGLQVHLLLECITARAAHNRQVGFDRMQMGGAIPCTTETALFELIRDSKHNQFKTIQRLIK